MVFIRAIPTTYQGVIFRSRTEARWAIYFDTMKIKWEYEPKPFFLEDLRCGYLPDFRLTKLKVWVEVKPTIPTDVERAKILSLVKATGEPCVCLSDNPDIIAYDLFVPSRKKPELIAMTNKLPQVALKDALDVGVLYPAVAKAVKLAKDARFSDTTTALQGIKTRKRVAV